MKEYISNKIDSLKGTNDLPTGVLSIGPYNSIIAMEAAADNDLSFLALHSAIGTDGKQYLIDKLCEPSYFMGGKEAAEIRNEIRSTLENATSLKSLDGTGPLSGLQNNEVIKRFFSFDVEKGVSSIQCPVILSFGYYDGITNWYSNLSNLENLLLKNNKEFSTLQIPEINQFFITSEKTLPAFTSVSYSESYVPRYDLKIIDMISEAINNGVD